MADLSAFPITARWPARNPDLIQLYSFPTPNGVKVSIALEELGLPYEAHPVDIMQERELDAGIPVAQPERQDPGDDRSRTGPDGKPLGLFESGAILIYLADKTGKLIPADAARALRDDAVGVLPDGVDRPDVRPGRLLPQIRRQARSRTSGRSNRYRDESKRLLGVMETRLKGRQWIMGDLYTIADISMLGWVRNLIGFYGARRARRVRQTFPNVAAWLERGLARPAVQRGLNIPARG